LNATAMMSTLHHVSLVRLHRVVVAFGGLRALNEIDLEVASGERLAILRMEPGKPRCSTSLRVMCL
jgi:ABC-type uncharacterized transport system ATPase subunit